MFRKLPHGFLNFPDLPDAGEAIERLRTWIFSALQDSSGDASDTEADET